jgi:hypothetical protein
MARCFCGCGRRVSLIRRPMNKSGQRVSDAVRFLRGVQEVGLDPSEQRIAVLASAGEVWRDDLADVVHGDRDSREFEVERMRAWLKDAWEVETTLTRGAHTESTPEERLDHARNQRELARWMRESGVSHEEAVRQLSNRAIRGEPPPWKD